MKKQRHFPFWIFLAAGLVALLLFNGALYLCGASFPTGVFWNLIAVLILTAAGMVLALRRSLAETYYDYRNIVLCGGIVFVVVLLASLFYTFLPLGGQAESVSALLGAIVSFPHRFSLWGAFGILGVCVLIGISNVALIRHEGFRPKNALSILLAAVYFGGTLAVSFLIRILEKFFLAASPAAAGAFTVLSLFLMMEVAYFECVFAGAAVMGFAASRKTPSLDRDYIIILGCSIDKKGGLLPLLKGRVNRAIRFAWEQEIATGKPLCYIPSGGQGPGEIMSEGSAMELYLKSRGAEDGEVFPEKESTNTRENFLFSKKIIDEHKKDAKIAFATTNYHILRSGILARKEGIDAEGVAGDTKWYFWPNGFVREFFGILTLEFRTHIAAAGIIALFCILLGVLAFFCL